MKIKNDLSPFPELRDMIAWGGDTHRRTGPAVLVCNEACSSKVITMSHSADQSRISSRENAAVAPADDCRYFAAGYDSFNLVASDAWYQFFTR